MENWVFIIEFFFALAFSSQAKKKEVLRGILSDFFSKLRFIIQSKKKKKKKKIEKLGLKKDTLL